MITTAVQKGAQVYVYSGYRQLFVKMGTLVGYTSTTVSIKSGGQIYTYNEHGIQISVHMA